MKTSDIKVVLFDVTGVLFPANTVVGEDIQATFGLSAEQLAPMWKGIYKDLSAGKINPEQFFDMVAGMYHLDRSLVNEDLFTRSFIKALKPVPGMPQLLDKLVKNKDITLAILSDTTPLHDQIRASEGYYKYFKKVFLSFEMGFLKPDARAFQAVIDYYKISPKQIFFVDDSPANVEAARKIGMQAEIFTDTPTLETRLVALGILPA